MKKLSDANLLRLYEEQIQAFDVPSTSCAYESEKENLVHTLHKVIAAKSERSAVRFLDSGGECWGNPEFCVAVVRSWVGIKPSTDLCFQALQKLAERQRKFQEDSARILKDCDLILHLARRMRLE